MLVLSVARAANAPIRKAPLTLTDIVPQGNVFPQASRHQAGKEVASQTAQRAANCNANQPAGHDCNPR